MNHTAATKLNIKDYIAKYDVLICQTRPSRIKAKQWAALEAATVLAPLGAIFITNTPIGDVQGLIAFFIPKDNDAVLRKLLNNLGYSHKFYKLDFNAAQGQPAADIKSINPYFWKGQPFVPIHFFSIDEAEFEAQSIANREFAVYRPDKTVKYIKGYRGDGSETGRRALPLEDARLMANLASPVDINKLLDPFAGGGGIICAAKRVNPSLHLISADIDSTIEPGLKMYATEHHTRDARFLRLDSQVDAIVTEVPFGMAQVEMISQALDNLLQYLTGRLVLMCHQDQFSKLGKALTGLFPIYHNQVNRKGTPIVISYWTKDHSLFESTKEYISALRGFI